MEASDTLVTRELIVEREDRSRQPVVIRIGKPYWVSENVEAACSLQIDGLYSKLADIRGVDLYQAVQLAMQLAETLLQSAALKKQRLLWPSGERYDSSSKAERKAPRRARKKAKKKRVTARRK